MIYISSKYTYIAGTLTAGRRPVLRFDPDYYYVVRHTCRHPSCHDRVQHMRPSDRRRYRPPPPLARALAGPKVYARETPAESERGPRWWRWLEEREMIALREGDLEWRSETTVEARKSEIPREKERVYL